MLNKTTLMNITNEVNNKKEETRMKAIEKFIDEVIAPECEKEARNGNYCAFIKFGGLGMDFDTVAQILVEQYQLRVSKTKFGDLNIMWN